jgi:hypothetical protein
MSATAMIAANNMTKRISSRTTFFYKKWFFVLWLGIAAVFLTLGIVGVVTQSFPRKDLPAFFIIPSVFAAVSPIFRRLFKDLIDEVYDGGDHLILKNGNDEELLSLTNVMNVGASRFEKPPRVTLRLVKPGRFGSEVSFLVERQSLLDPFVRNVVVDDLIVRVDRARMRRVS